MQCEQIRSRLADFLGGEMSSADAARVHEHLSHCPSCEREISGLRMSVGTLAEGALPLEIAQERAAALRLPLQAERILIRRPFSIAFTLVRYAAVIAISFGAGYYLRTGGGESGNATKTGDAPDSGMVFAQRYEAAGRAYPKAAGISKGLLALANSDRHGR